jgi:hypothetical protein
VLSSAYDRGFWYGQAVTNVAEKSVSGKITIQVEGTNEKGFDLSWLRDAAEEPLEQADIE